MNWWSAFTWCESQGRKLADFATMCPGVPQIPSDREGDCPNLQGIGDGPVWSSLAYDNYNAIYVMLSSGAVKYALRNHNSSATYAHYYALCE